MPGLAPWELRVHKAVLIGQWVALVVGVVADLVSSGGSASSIAAMVVASIYAIGATALPERWLHIRFGVEAVTLGGTLLLGVALTLTGGADSPYLLLSIGPTTIATLYGGIRSGLTTGLLAAALLWLVSIPNEVPLSQVGQGMGLYVMFVFLIGLLRRLLRDIYAQASELASETEQARQQLESLEQTHSILIRLSEDISAGRLNAVEVGAETLDSLLSRFPQSAGRLVIDGDDGPVVLAARGVPVTDGYHRTFPLVTADVDVGRLELTTSEIMSNSAEEEVRKQVRPVAIAFANLQLLQDIVGAAVAEERMRLAREMHDEIGPSLASLGLALDMTAMQQASIPEVSADLMILRSNVTKLVEDVRASVADLRSAPGPTLTARLLQTVATLGDTPRIVVDLDERRPPRPALIGDVTALITEAMRNAHNHSKGSQVLITGRVDRGFGSCQIIDDGIGFDPDYEPEGHFGLMGMRERAEKIDARIVFESESGRGTTITVEWGNK
ncbi:MAG: histidine kinase [Acidimicrobiia bacterium]|nr:histidine kinase [Acidimicrobiia bacterium]MDH3463118.1 histidine kinase [Acidimicrobiia bacterium]